MRATTGTAIGTTLAALGAALVVLLVRWRACLGGDGAPCRAAAQDDLVWALPAVVWLVALAASAVLVLASGTRHGLPLLGVAALVVVNPLTDRGAFFLPWDTADTIPFSGVPIALAVMLAGATLSISARRSTRSGRASLAAS